MKKFILSLSLALVSVLTYAQNHVNMTFVANVPYTENCNDIWGYVDGNGTEYAILGTTQATAILSLADPSNPVEVAYIPGASSTWRDMKHWGNFVYVTTDVGSDGLLVIDMTGAPNNITWEFWKPEITINGNPTTLATCHNIYIDENGVAYLAGCNMNGGGVLMVDVATTPGSPEFIGASDPRYSHDAFTRGDTLWSSEINNGQFAAIDISDKTAPVTLATQNTSFNFTHNAWLSDDGNYLFTTDERGNAFVDSYDVSDLTDIKFLDAYRPADTEGLGVIPHNTHYHNGFLVTSWYTDGVKVIDASQPDNLVEVASYDTFEGPHGGFSGCWGVYPYLPSGLVIASDINSGLWVLEPNYVQASFLEGIVSAENTGMSLNDVEVVIESSVFNTTATDPMGAYKTGQAEAGTFDVTFSKAGYEDKTVSVTLASGEITTLNVELVSLPTITISGQTVRDADDNPIQGAKVLIINEQFRFELETDAMGNFATEAFLDDYTIYAGAWGYENIEVGAIDLSGGTVAPINIRLAEGYQDDFMLDYGWTVLGAASTGAWEKGEPVGTFFGSGASNPEMDIDGDVGNECYTTGNGGGGGGDDDIDGGNTILTSPSMDLTTYNNPILAYNLWFVNGGGNGTPNDRIEVAISNSNNPADAVILETLTVSDSEGNWKERSSFILSDHIEITANMRLIVTTGDDAPGHIVEAAIDAFAVSDADPTPTADIINEQLLLSAYPNPFDKTTLVDYSIDTENAILKVYNTLGQVIESTTLTQKEGQLNLGATWEKGIYFVQIHANGELSQSTKVIKQ